MPPRPPRSGSATAAERGRELRSVPVPALQSPQRSASVPRGGPGSAPRQGRAWDADAPAGSGSGLSWAAAAAQPGPAPCGGRGDSGSHCGPPRSDGGSRRRAASAHRADPAAAAAGAPPVPAARRQQQQQQPAARGAPPAGGRRAAPAQGAAGRARGGAAQGKPKRRQPSELELAKEAAARLQEELEQAAQREERLQAERAAVEAERDAALHLADGREAELISVRAELRSVEEALRRKEEELAGALAERDARYAQYEDYMREGEELRTELHNQLIEIKGNIRVFCRVRPLLPRELHLFPKNHYAFPDAVDHRVLHVVDVPGHTSAIPGASEQAQTLPFNFDRVFGPDLSQEAIFSEISQLVQSALDGYKVCIFAYGQTGSGKTYTMEGPEPGAASETSGMIPRAVDQIFQSCQRKSERSGFSIRLLCSFVEIYNEHVHDLLNPQEYSKMQGGSEGQSVNHDIRHQDGETIVVGATETEVSEPGQVYQLLRIAADSRRTGATKMNEYASRSHSVFMMKIHGRNDATQQAIRGQLNLIDLAGSERLKKSQAVGERLRETQHINKSLSTLGDVIAALARGDGGHIPFRSSKLTYLLQPSMSNESKTLMFVNINPVSEHLSESINSLRFAAKVNACEIGIARRRVLSPHLASGSSSPPSGGRPCAAARSNSGRMRSGSQNARTRAPQGGR
eukprot:TRINITY_DN6621_c0_g1_i2.p1 TRINITY_DN6621_c0_g1~~TRINITY_DN6621_c0_g1_i2.p1  ORF type:complete len:712 (+),score=242.43 TRINITY_DN6621_c0_g1_i2:79-2136(+)